jgi:hypothetical protein
LSSFLTPIERVLFSNRLSGYLLERELAQNLNLPSERKEINLVKIEQSLFYQGEIHHVFFIVLK